MEPIASGDHHVAAARAFQRSDFRPKPLGEEIAGAMDL